MIQWFRPVMGAREENYVVDALKSSWISDGEYVQKFEKALSTELQVPHAISVSNGTTAIHLAMLTLGITRDDEVIVPGFGFSAPANMAFAVGAQPVAADVDPHDWCITAEAIEKKITPRTKAIAVVHTYGNVCDMDKINQLADAYKLSVIEDNAEAAFSRYKGRFAGTLSDIGCFSFQATKTLTTGEGGAVVLHDENRQRLARLIRNHGMDRKRHYWHEVVGYNFRLTNIQAAIGCAQLEQLDSIVEGKRRVTNFYQERLELDGKLRFQHFSDDVDPVVWANALILDEGCAAAQRDELANQLKQSGIETRPGFYSLNQMPLYGEQATPVSDDISCRILSLPSFPTLTDDELNYICEITNGLIKKL